MTPTKILSKLTEIRKGKEGLMEYYRDRFGDRSGERTNIQRELAILSALENGIREFDFLKRNPIAYSGCHCSKISSDALESIWKELEGL